MSDAHTGEPLGPNHEEYGPWLDAPLLACEGIGPIHALSVPIAGIDASGLPLMACGWHLELVARGWPDSFVVLCTQEATVLSERVSGGSFKLVPMAGHDDDVVYAFSPSGSTFVVASCDTIELFSREHAAAKPLVAAQSLRWR